MQVMIETRQNVQIDLKPEEAMLFVEFQKNYQVVAYLLGYLSSLKIAEMNNTNLTMDIDSNGKVSHTSITKHYRA